MLAFSGVQVSGKIVGYSTLRFWLQASRYRPAATGMDLVRCSDICFLKLQTLLAFGCLTLEGAKANWWQMAFRFAKKLHAIFHETGLYLREFIEIFP